MKAGDRKLGLNVVFAATSFGLAIAVGLYVYKFLWGVLPPKEFSLWFIAFELSQFLLLLDLGFSHKFIAKHSRLGQEEYSSRLNELRFVLLVAATTAVLLFFVVVFLVAGWPSTLRVSFVLLAGSLFLNLAGYAETAALRVQFRNNEIYAISIASQLIFILILLFLPFPEAVRIGVAIFFRSLLVYLAQIQRVREAYSPKWVRVNHFGGAVVAINAAYFILFMLDAAILGMTAVTAASIATILVVRKYFDLVRALWDSMLPNLYARFAVGNDSAIYLVAVISCATSYFFASILANFILSAWLHGFSSDFIYYFGLGVSFFSITIFRMTTLRLFYKNSLNWKIFLMVGVLVKLLFAGLLVILNLSVPYSYLVQGVALLLLVAYFGMTRKVAAVERSI